MNNKIDELVNLLYEFDVLTSKMEMLIDEIYNSDKKFMEIFNNNYIFDNSYDEELIKHTMFLYDVLRKYGKDI